MFLYSSFHCCFPLLPVAHTGPCSESLECPKITVFSRFPISVLSGSVSLELCWLLIPWVYCHSKQVCWSPKSSFRLAIVVFLATLPAAQMGDQFISRMWAMMVWHMNCQLLHTNPISPSEDVLFVILSTLSYLSFYSGRSTFGLECCQWSLDDDSS